MFIYLLTPIKMTGHHNNNYVKYVSIITYMIMKTDESIFVLLERIIITLKMILFSEILTISYHL